MLQVPRIKKNVSKIRELFPISGHVTSTVTLGIFKQVHPILRSLTLALAPSSLAWLSGSLYLSFSIYRLLALALAQTSIHNQTNTLY